MFKSIGLFTIAYKNNAIEAIIHVRGINNVESVVVMLLQFNMHVSGLFKT